MVMKSRGYSPSEIGKWFITQVDRDSGDEITHLKLQKLIYYAQAWWIANKGEALFDEDMQAWTHGPVVPSIWQEYKNFGWEALPPVENYEFKVPDEIKAFLANVYKTYGKFSAKYLEDLTHREDPWKITRGSLPLEAKCEVPINKDLMKDYYGKRIS